MMNEGKTDMTTAVNEEYIERIYEREMNKIDRLLMDGVISQSEYDDEVLSLCEWAEDMYNTYNERI
jgi:hypothetical protein